MIEKTKTVRSHLADVHRMAADDARVSSEYHARAAGQMLAIAKCLRDGKPDEAANSFESLAREFSARSATQLQLCKFLGELAAELDGGISEDLQDMSGSQPRAGLINNDKSAGVADGADRFTKIKPDNVHGIIPTAPQVRLIPRPGQPAPEATVDPQFAELVKTNEPL